MKKPHVSISFHLQSAFIGIRWYEQTVGLKIKPDAVPKHIIQTTIEICLIPCVVIHLTSTKDK